LPALGHSDRDGLQSFSAAGARIVLIPPGALCRRIAVGAACGARLRFVAFYVIRRSAFAGVLVGRWCW
jgi:hypothetical protein